ncbi:acyl-CoA thioesterase [Alteromonas sp. CYL-A6]|uniref:acyl-CoA thioesterase n=1 Tax=Alteromonas nitratireducens TaxID=3390813 RepID=UPI0034B39442
MSETRPFTYLLRVRYSECDPQNVVFNARYGDYADISATEFMRAVWGNYADVVARGLDNQVVKLTMTWQSSARFDDVLAIRVHASHIGTTSFTLSMVMHHHETQREIARAEVIYVMVDNTTFKKCSIPDDMKASLSKGAHNRVVDHAGVL